MSLRRALLAAALAALMLVPGTGNAIGEPTRQVSGSSCTLGNEILAFNGDVGQWEGRSTVTCPPKPDGSPNNQAQIDSGFVVVLVQGVTTFPQPMLTGSTVFPSRDPVTGSTVYSCQACPGIQAFGAHLTLGVGLYEMRSSVVITQNTQAGTVYRRGAHSTCFLIRGENVEVTAVPGCSL